MRPADIEKPTSGLRPRPYAIAKPLALTERRVGAMLFSVERYRGFFAAAHSHPELQLTLPLDGRKRMQVGGEDLLAGPGEVFVLPPALPHAATLLDGEHAFFSVLVPAGWLADGATALDLPAPALPLRARVVSDPLLWPLARQLAAELEQPQPGGDRVLTAGLEQIQVLLVRALAAPAPAAPRQDGRILRAVDRIVRDHAEELTVEGLAAELHLTPRHFERRFRAELGTSPRRYLIDVRLAAARHLLEASEMSVSEVGLEVGFSTPSHFIATFRRAVGVTPGTYRERQRA